MNICYVDVLESGLRGWTATPLFVGSNPTIYLTLCCGEYKYEQNNRGAGGKWFHYRGRESSSEDARLKPWELKGKSPSARVVPCKWRDNV